MTRKIVVVGWGPAAHRFVTGLLSGGGDGVDADIAVTVYAADGAVAHDRDALPGVLAEGAALASAALPAIDDPRLEVRAGVRVTAVDRMHRVVHATDHRVQHYDALVLATGANPVLPPIRGLRAADGRSLMRGVHPAHSA
ncbi:MAG: FAD-dependent oxidoreductase, partial [Catenulispora sp.]|nr:FAD-dependent oxidoreductase [Catenulispora sp.]